MIYTNSKYKIKDAPTKILISFLFTILIAISSKISVPFYPVPMTMQTFVVLFLGVLLGPKLAATTILFYLCEGILGLPVFSNSPEKGIGFVYFTGPTMGYLIGFIFASYFAGYINTKDSYIKIYIKSVSYTHLTLPTIVSV